MVIPLLASQDLTPMLIGSQWTAMMINDDDLCMALLDEAHPVQFVLVGAGPTLHMHFIYFKMVAHLTLLIYSPRRKKFNLACGVV